MKCNQCLTRKLAKFDKRLVLTSLLATTQNVQNHMHNFLLEDCKLSLSSSCQAFFSDCWSVLRIFSLKKQGTSVCITSCSFCRHVSCALQHDAKLLGPRSLT